MSRKTKWVLGLILILALASFGVAYGAWTQSLTITGTARTGSMSFQAWTGDDFKGATAPYGDPHTWLTHDNEPAGTNVGTCTSVSNGLSTNVDITLDKVYPGYECYVWIGALNKGSVPVALTQPTFTGMPDWVKPVLAPTGGNPDDADYCYGDGYRVAVNYGQQCKITFQVTDDAPEDTHAEFSGSITVSQSTGAEPPVGHCFQAAE